MVRCEVCGKEDFLPYKCTYCGGRFCGEHRLPEKHQCPNLPKEPRSSWRNNVRKGVVSEKARSQIREKEKLSERGAETVSRRSSKSSRSLKPLVGAGVVIIVVVVSIYIVFINQGIEIDSLHIDSKEILSGDPLYISVSVSKSIVSYLEDVLNVLNNFVENVEEMEVKMDGVVVIKDEINLRFNENTTNVYSIIEKEPGRHIINVGSWTEEFEVLKIARFEGSNIDLSDHWLGEDVNVSVVIRNVGGVADKRFIFCYLDDKEIGKVRVDLEPEQSVTVIFSFLANDAGIHRVTFGWEYSDMMGDEFEVKRVRFEGGSLEITPNNPWVGENMGISLKIVNIDGARSTKKVFCYIDSNEVEKMEITLDPEQSTVVSVFCNNVSVGLYNVSFVWGIDDVRSKVTEMVSVSNPDNPIERPEYYYSFAKDYVYGKYTISNNKNIEGLVEFLDQLEFPEYKAGRFDCSESSSVLEWLLEGAGFHAYVARKTGLLSSHAWVQVEIENDIVALESTQLTYGWGYDDYDNIKPWGIVSKSDGTYRELTYQYRYRYQMFLDWKEEHSSSVYVWDRNITFGEWVDRYLSSIITISVGGGVPDKTEYYERFRGYESPIPIVEGGVRIFSGKEYDWWDVKPYSTIFPFSEW